MIQLDSTKATWQAFRTIRSKIKDVYADEKLWLAPEKSPDERERGSIVAKTIRLLAQRWPQAKIEAQHPTARNLVATIWVQRVKIGTLAPEADEFAWKYDKLGSLGPQFSREELHRALLADLPPRG